MEVKTGTVVSVAPEDPEAIVVVDINGKAVSICGRFEGSARTQPREGRRRLFSIRRTGRSRRNPLVSVQAPRNEGRS